MKIWNEMEHLVKQKLKYFQSDFYDCDKKMYQELKKGESFLWCVRVHGTWFLPLENQTEGAYERHLRVIAFYPEQCPSEKACWYLIKKDEDIDALTTTEARAVAIKYRNLFMKAR